MIIGPSYQIGEGAPQRGSGDMCTYICTYRAIYGLGIK